MDLVIRAPRMDGRRTRLAPAGGEPGRGLGRDGGALPPPAAPSDVTLASWRRELGQQVRAELTAQAEALFAAERERGRTEGRADGHREAMARTEHEARAAQQRRDERLAQALATFAEAQGQLERRLESVVGEIAFAAVCRLVGEAAPTREWVSRSVEAACAELRDEARASVRLHPRDLALLDPQGRGELRLAGRVLRLVGDDTLTPGGCHVDLRLGGLDASLETRLARLHATLVAAAPLGES